jgi:hypothetical protein
MTTSNPSMRSAPTRRTPFARRSEPLRAPFPRRADAAERLHRLTERARAELSGTRLGLRPASRGRAARRTPD